MIILKLVLWMVLGWITIFTVLLVHVIRAHLKGYNALDWLSENYTDPISTPNGVLRFIFGLIIWPVRLYTFIRQIPWLYTQYELLWIKSLKGKSTWTSLFSFALKTFSIIEEKEQILNRKEMNTWKDYLRKRLWL